MEVAVKRTLKKVTPLDFLKRDFFHIQISVEKTEFVVVDFRGIIDNIFQWLPVPAATFKHKAVTVYALCFPYPAQVLIRKAQQIIISHT